MNMNSLIIRLFPCVFAFSISGWKSWRYCVFVVLQVGAVFEVAGLPSYSVGFYLFSSWKYKLVSFVELRYRQE